MIPIDRVEIGRHLRRVHFTFVIACVSLFAIIAADPGSEYVVAFHDFENIQLLIANWDDEWLHNYATKVADGKTKVIGLKLDGSDLQVAAPDAYVYLKAHDESREGDDVAFRLSVRKWTLFGPDALESFSSENRLEYAEIGGLFYWPRITIASERSVTDLKVDMPQSLAEFRRLWHVLGQLEKVYVVSSVGQKAQFYPGHKIMKSESAKSWVGLTEISADGLAGNFLLTNLAVITSDERLSGDWWREDFSDWPENMAFMIEAVSHGFQREVQFSMPVTVTEIYISPRIHLGLLQDLKWSSWDYENAFPELAKLTKELDDLPFHNLEGYLRTKSRESQGYFELLGLKIPARVVSTWGAVIIFIMQFYLFIHLKNFKTAPVDVELATGYVPWIGFYDDSLSRAAYFLTAVILPCFVTVWITAYEIESAILATDSVRPWHWSWQTWIPVFFLGLVIAVSIGMAKCIQSIWRNEIESTDWRSSIG